MLTDWLVKRLTPCKRVTARWVDLARAIQTFWESNFDGELDTCSRLNSIYTADLAGKRRIVAELGDYFQAGDAEISIPLLVAVRKLELAMKDTDYLIRAAIQRKESTLSDADQVKWLPLWALESDGAYGTQFHHEGIGIPDGAYLTSRGILWTTRAQMIQEDLDIDMLVRTIKPLHITYDGLQSSDPGFWASANLITQAGEHVLTGDGNNVVTE